MASKLLRLRELVGEGSKESEMKGMPKDDIMTLAEENKRLKQKAKEKEAELRDIHVILFFTL